MGIASEQTGRKVLHILDRSIPDLVGYSIRSKYIVEFQRSIGISPYVVTSPKYERNVEYEKIGSTLYYRCYSPPRGIDRLLMAVPFAREQRIMRKLERKVAEIVNVHKIDILHAHSPSLCGIPALKVAQRWKLPLVYEIRALWEDAAVDRGRFAEKSLKYIISEKVEQRLIDKCDAIVCICEGLRSEIAPRRNKGNIFVTQNGVDTTIFAPREKAGSLVNKFELEGKIVIGFIGSFFTFEGLADLIASVPKVAAEQENVRLLIVGGGVEEANVKRQAAELGVLEEIVIFVGRVPHEEIQDYYSIMDIMVYPRISKRITELVTPLKPLEAMAMEKAVVASDVGGLKELIRDGVTGLLYEAGNIDHLAERIVHLARNEKKRKLMAENARLQMRAEREWSKIVPKYLDIYEKLVRNK
jgi:PEP-CTERM/exosortase A-associated glycosyltransferase